MSLNTRTGHEYTFICEAAAVIGGCSTVHPLFRSCCSSIGGCTLFCCFSVPAAAIRNDAGTSAVHVSFVNGDAEVGVKG